MKLVSALGLLLAGLLVAACNINTPNNPTPTAEVLISATPTAEATLSSTPSPSPTVTETDVVDDVPVQISTPLPTQPDIDMTPLPTATSEAAPCEVTVQQGDTLTIMLFRQPCGNQVNQGLINAVVAFNDNLFDPNILPAIGSTIRVPRPTPTPIPPGADMTETAAAASGVTIIGGQQFVEGQDFGCHIVQEGESILGIMEQYNTTLEILSQQNPNLNWLGCDFTNPSGGPNCNPSIRVDECINVPLPTPTPVPTSTPSGDETATPTPTHLPARAFYPPEGAVASSGRIALQWVSVGVLQPGEVYLVEVVDRTTEQQEAFVTSSTRFTLPDRLIPSDGQTHLIAWRVSVATQNPDGTYTSIGGRSAWRTFQWQSRE